MLYGLGLVANVYYNSRTTSKIKLKCESKRYTKKRQMEHIKCLLKTRKGRKRKEDKTGNKEQGQKIVANMVAINPVVSVIILESVV